MIKSIEKSSVHRITSGQVLVDLQTAVKELVENSLDAGATTIEVKFKEYGLKSFEVSDNGSGIAPEDYDSVAIRHCTSKLSTFEDLSTVQTFGFRGEALSSLCALTEKVTMITATAKSAPMGTVLEFDKFGKVKSRSGKAARQRGTTVTAEGLFVPLPVRRKEFERNSKREFGKALTLLSAYALVPCTKENKGVRLNVVHIVDKGRKSDQIRTDGKPSLKASISSLWGPKQVESLVELNLDLEVLPEKSVLRRQANINNDDSATKIQVRGLISKFSHGQGRTGADRQFFFINGRPCNPSKIQKAFNEVYRTFNTNQSPFIVADFILPTNTCDINVSPDKRTILLHSENALVAALKETLETTFAPERSTFTVQSTQLQQSVPKARKPSGDELESSEKGASSSQEAAIDIPSSDSALEAEIIADNPAELMDIQRSPTLSLAVPAALLESEESQQNSSPHEPTLRPPSPQQPAPLLVASGLSPAPQIQSRPRSRSPLVSKGTPSPGPSKPNARSVQMVLNTADASWAMLPAGEGSAQKKRKTDGVNSVVLRTYFRSQLAEFASSGSQPARVDSDVEMGEGSAEDEDSDEEKAENIVEEDELAGEELDEMRVDSNVDIDKSSAVDKVAKETTSDLDDSIDDVGSESLFPSEIKETPVRPGRGISSRVKKELIELDIDGPASSPIDLNSKNLLIIAEPTSEEVETPAAKSSLSSSISASTVQSGSSVGVEFMRTADANFDVSVSFDIRRIDSVWNSISAKGRSALENISPVHETRTIDPLAGLSNTSDEESAEGELARVICKEDFSSMDIIGQFNLGFIIARRRLCSSKEGPEGTHNQQSLSSAKVNLDDLFIIDQHAADEKYNFETLQQTTKIDSQKLYRPRPLELTAADELLAIENIDILKSNGFEISVDEDVEPSQGRIKLVAQPVSGSTNFDMKDLEELLHLMQDRPAGQKMVRCSKARAMFAMRACRKSVMIGDPLNKLQMTSVVRHMGTMDQPWNCPHGRPTMRHLTSLNDVTSIASNAFLSATRTINWDDL